MSNGRGIAEIYKKMLKVRVKLTNRCVTKQLDNYAIHYFNHVTGSCMYVYVCMYVCMYDIVYMYVCMYVCTYVCMTSCGHIMGLD